MNLYFMHPSKIVRLIATLAWGAALHLACAQTPTVLSAQGSPLVFELAATPDVARHLTLETTAKLATPAQHAERSLTYPLWLSDANFSVKTRARQRQSVVVEAKRGNPELSTDLLLVFNNRGVRTLEPSTLIFDKINIVAGAPMPPRSQAAQLELASGFASALKTTAPIRFSVPEPGPAPVPVPTITPKQTLVATSHAVSQPSVENHVNVSLPPIYSETAQRQSTARKVIVKTASVPASDSKAISVMASQASPPVAQVAYGLQPTLPAQALNTAPSSILPPRPSPPRPQSPLPPPTTSWMNDWLLLAGAATAVLLLIYLLAQLFKNRAKSRQSKAKSSPTDFAANTVFGLSDEESEAMRKKWLRDQILQKSNK